MLKSFQKWIAAISILAVGIGCSEQEQATENILQQEINTFDELKANFQDPPAHYRSAPFWVWNGRVTEEKINRQLRQFKEQGIGGVFIHPRMGLITPYLSDRWHELYDYAVQQAEAMDMKVYLYDENSFPSGFAGGHVPAEMPESVNQGHGLALERAETLTEEASDEYHLILKKEGDTFINITENVDEESGNEGSYYLYKKVFYEKNDPWHGGFSYVDLILPGVTEKFIEITTSGYQQNFGEEFGNIVPAIFSDEANVEYPDVDNSIRWTPDLFEQFQQRWGYDLRTKLPLMYEETGNWRQVRHNYFTLLGDLFVERWAKPYSEFAESNNLLWTGHHFDHDWPKPKNGGDWAALASYQQMPGIDVLFNEYGEGLRDVNTQFGNARAVKELSSVANQTGRNRAISETYGGAGWNLTFQEMKRIADWQFVLGVNFLNQHLSYMTIKGSRKRDYPPSFSYHEPWWPHYGVLGDYFGRLSLAMSAGEQINHTLVLMPTTSAWMYRAPSGTPSHIDFYNIGDRFQGFVNDLEEFQVEYDLGSERVIEDRGSVRDSSFIVGERSYDRVVLPPGLQNVDSSTLELLNTYVEQGGQIIFAADSLPDFVDGAPSAELEKLQASAEKEKWTRMGDVTSSAVEANLSSTDFQITTDPDTSNGKFFHRRMQLADGQLLLLVNTSENERAEGTVEIAGQSVQQLNLLSGDIRPYESQLKDKDVSFSFTLPPVGSQLFYINNQQNEAETVSDPGQWEQGEILETGPMQVRREQPNVLTLDYVDLTIDGQTEQDIYYAEAAEEIFEHHGFEEGNPWYMTVQYKTRILDRDNYGPESGFTATYSFEVEEHGDDAQNTLEAVVEQPDLWEISVNGHTVAPDSGNWWLDREFGVYQIDEFVEPGSNQITLHASPMTVFSELERVFIRGDFALKSTNEGWTIMPDQPLETGSWNQQGMPFYADKVSYTKEISQLSPEDDSRYLVRLNEWNGTVAAVDINGEQAGIIGWPPYELDVTEALQEGKNSITVEVYGSLRNLLGPHHENPRRWRVSPGEFGDGPEHQPPGSDYDIISYGLMEEFDLVRVH